MTYRLLWTLSSKFVFCLAFLLFFWFGLSGPAILLAKDADSLGAGDRIAFLSQPILQLAVQLIHYRPFSMPVQFALKFPVWFNVFLLTFFYLAKNTLDIFCSSKRSQLPSWVLLVNFFVVSLWYLTMRTALFAFGFGTVVSISVTWTPMAFGPFIWRALYDFVVELALLLYSKSRLSLRLVSEKGDEALNTSVSNSPQKPPQ